MYFEVRLKHGGIKKSYLVSAVSYTEAESRVIMFFEEQFPGEAFNIVKISTSKVDEIIEGCTDNTEETEEELFYYKVKVVSTDEETEKKCSRLVVVKAMNPEGCMECTDFSDNGEEIVKIEKTKLCGIILSSKQSE